MQTLHAPTLQTVLGLVLINMGPGAQAELIDNLRLYLDDLRADVGLEGMFQHVTDAESVLVLLQQMHADMIV